MSRLMKGEAAGTTENDQGTQGGSPAGGLPATEADITKSFDKFAPGSAKAQGYVNVDGTAADGHAKK